MSHSIDTGFNTTENDGVYEMIFDTITPNTLDAYFAKLEAIFDTTAPDQNVAILLYSGSNMPALQNMVARDRALRAKYARVPFVRLAVMYDRQAHFSLVNLMMRMVNMNRHMAMRMFHQRDREDALAWLRR